MRIFLMKKWVNFVADISFLPWSLDDDVHKRLLVPNVVWSNGNLFIPWSRVTMIPKFAANYFVWSVTVVFTRRSFTADLSGVRWFSFIMDEYSQQLWLCRYCFLWWLLVYVQCRCANGNSIHVSNAYHALCTIPGDCSHWNHVQWDE